MKSSTEEIIKEDLAAVLLQAIHQKAEKIVVSRLLETGANPNKVFDSTGGCALHWAVAINNDREIIKLLLQHHANPNLQDTTGRTPLVLASEGKKWDLVLTIIGCKRSLKPSADELGAALWDAIHQNKPTDIVCLLLAAGANPNRQLGRIGSYPLHLAITHSINSQAIIELLLQHGADPNLRNTKGQSPLVIASEDNRWDLVLTIIRCKRSLKPSADELGAALGDAIGQNMPTDIVCLLLAEGANPNRQLSRIGSYPLHLAITHLTDSQAITELLLQHHADPNLRDTRGKSPLVIASEGNRWDLVLTIIGCKRSLKPSADELGAALWYAINFKTELAIVQVLLEAGANPNLTFSTTGDSPLHLAVTYNPEPKEIIKLLILYGADTSLTDEIGKTALRKAFDNKKLASVDAYREASAIQRDKLNWIIFQRGVFRDRSLLVVLKRGKKSQSIPQTKEEEIRLTIRLFPGLELLIQNFLLPSKIFFKKDEASAPAYVAKKFEKIIEARLKVEKFKKIYNALRNGQSGVFKTNFFERNKHLYPIELEKKIINYTKTYPHSRTAKAWSLTEHYSSWEVDNTPSPNLIAEIYRWTFKESGLFSLSKSWGATFFRVASLNAAIIQKREELSLEEIKAAVAKNGNSRTANIYNALTAR